MSEINAIGISVIIPIYNVELYIERCVRSLMEQTLENIEFIFVNDCTPDKSMIILQRVLEEYPVRKEKVKIIEHKQNKGIAATRNTGLKYVSGQYIIYCDSDDWIERDMYEKLLKKALVTCADIVACDYYDDYINYSIIRKQLFSQKPQECVLEMMRGNLHCSTWNKLIVRTLYERTKIIFPEFDIMMETPQNNPHHKYNVGIHTIEAMKQIEAEHIYRWTMLLHDVGKPTARVEGPDKDHFKMHPVIGEEMARKILRRLKFDNQTIKQVTTLVRWHDRRFASMEEVNKKTVRRWVSQLTPELFTRLMEVQKADISAQSDYQRDKKEQVLQETKKLFEEIIEEKNCLSIKELKINGKDLMDMGVPQGKEIGQILSWLLDQVLEDPQLNERETLTRMAEEKRDEK